MHKSIKKIIPYFLILIILVGLVSPMVKVNAAVDPNAPTAPAPAPAAPAPVACTGVDNSTGTAVQTPAGCTSTSTTTATGNAANYIGGCQWDFWNHIDDCILTGGYYIFFTVPALLLYVTAKFFNFMIILSISNTAQGLSGFVSGAWTVVRDLSNIFFILILLYVAIQTILGMSHETKKIIVHVIIMALLINFSLFFTKVVIDSSNILALVFYNKLEVNQSRPYESAYTKNEEHDIAGEIYDRFNPTTVLLDGKLFKQIQDETGAGTLMVFGYKMGMMLIAFAVMTTATWVFIVSAFLFLGRLVELWVLMIFSPFAFMSWSMPELFKDIEYINWNTWLKKLIATSFMAPIYMFFLYLIFKLWGDPSVFSSLIKPNGGFWATILGVLIPAGIIIVLLRKAVDIAKKGGGAVGEKFSKGIEMLGGLATTAAIGAASGGAALALRAGVTAGTGKLATMAAKPGSRLGNFSGQLKDFDSFARKRTFDLRAAPEGIKSLASKGNIFAVQEGGLEGIEKRQIEKRKKRADELEKRGTVGHKKTIEEAEIRLKEVGLKELTEEIDGKKVTLPVKLHVENAEKKLKEAKEDMANAAPENKKVASQAVKDAKDALKKIKENSGIKEAEEAVRMAKSNLEVESSQIRGNFAAGLENMSTGMKVFHTIRKMGAYSAGADKEAARKVRLGENYSGGEKKDKPHTQAPKDINYKPADSKPAPGGSSSGSGGHTPAPGGTPHTP